MDNFIMSIMQLRHYVKLLLVFATSFLAPDLFSQPFQNGDVFIAVSDGRVQWRSPTGVLKQTLNTTLGGYTTGMAFDAADNLYVTNFSANNVSRFNSNGVLLGTFGSGYSTPESIVFDQAGNVYVGNLGNGIRKYNATGTYLGTSYTGRVDFMDLAADQCTMVRTTEGTFIGTHNVCTNVAGSNFANGLGGSAYALRIRENGEVLVANGSNILRVSTTGTILQTYDVTNINSWFALNLNPDGTSFWSADINTANVYKIDIATGNVLTSFNTGTGGSTVYGLAVFGEFTVSVCADNVAPTFAPSSRLCGSTIEVVAGANLAFTVAASDVNAGDKITLNVTGLPTGATLIPTLPTTGNSPQSTSFSWTPALADIGSHTVTFSATDDCGLQAFCTYTIKVVGVDPPTEYYSKAAGDLHNVLSWGVNMDGSGENPSDFGAGKTFHLVNRVPIYTMTADWTVGGKLDIPAGSQLRINGSTLSIADLIGTGTLYGSTTSNLVVAGTGGDPGILNFAAGGGSLNNLTINRLGALPSATIGANLSIYGVLNLFNGTLNTGNKITLKSTAANTARVAPVTGSISGNVTVERYIPARRAWRIMSAPVGGSQSINLAWQEGATTSSANPDPNPGYGTHITEGNAANGFDHNPLVAMLSVKKYVSASDTWSPLGNTNATSVNSDAFLLFIRGERSIPLGYNTVPPTNTTLRATGPLKTGNQVFPVSASGFTAIPNPYASPVNFATLTRTANVPNNFYVWDPKLGGEYGVGGYVLFTFNGSGYDIIPAPISPESQFIQSGQGFLVHSTGGAGSITIKETDKSATAATNVFRSKNTTKGLRTTLQITNDNGEATSVIDETFTSYSPYFANKVDNMDAEKLSNINENLGTSRDGRILMMERRKENAGNDTIFLKLWNTTAKKYQLQISPENLLSSTAETGYLEDLYLHTTTPISLSEPTAIGFAVDASVASSSPDRFRIVLSFKKSVLPEGYTDGSFKISPNPFTGKSINIQFIDQPKGTYHVEMVNTAGQIVFKGQLKHGGGTAAQSLRVLNSNIVKGLVYRMRIRNEQGKLVSAIPVLSN